jgi:hypothetical protein
VASWHINGGFSFRRTIVASWHINATWTPELANRLADILTEYGAGDGPVLKLRASAANGGGGVLGQRAEIAYDYARPIIDADCDRAGDPARYRRFIREVGAVLAEAAGEDVPGDDTSDWIREAVIARADELNLTAEAIAARTDGAVSRNHVREFLARRKQMTSGKLGAVMTALGMTVK